MDGPETQFYISDQVWLNLWSMEPVSEQDSLPHPMTTQILF